MQIGFGERSGPLLDTKGVINYGVASQPACFSQEHGTWRGILAERGQKVEIDDKGKIKVIGTVGDAKELLKYVKPKQWNDYTVIANRGHIVLKINDVVMCEIEDNDPRRVPTGKLALQVHQGPPMLVQFKDIRLREL